MKQVSAEFQAHLNGALTTCAELVRIVRVDGVTIGLTTHDCDIVYGGVTYKADGAYEAGAMRQSAGLKADDYDIAGLIGSEAIAEADLRAGLYDHARIDVYLCNWADLSQGLIHLRRGWIGEVRYAEGRFEAGLRGFHDLLDRRVCETYTPECRFDLGDSRCGVSLTPVTGSVTGLVDELHFIDYKRGEVDGTFQDAKLTWTSGANSGTSVEVRSWKSSARTFGLWLACEHPIGVGDSYSVVSGCDKRFATCKARFGNAVHYGGFPYLPGLGKILLYPDARS